MKFLRDKLKDPLIKGVDIDSPEILFAHREIIKNKPLMKSVFNDFYTLLIDKKNRYFSKKGKQVEIGAGVSFFKEVNPEVITSDIKNNVGLDMVVNAQDMPFQDDSVSAIYGINCFHHFPEPRKFFAELVRVLESGGGCLLIEPSDGPFARILYKNVHAEEHFDLSQSSWETSDEMNYMSGANQALASIIFKRDRELFEREFPELELIEIKRINNYLQYLFSGGVNFIQLVPNFLIPFVKLIELLLTPINYLFSLHSVFVIRKK